MGCDTQLKPIDFRYHMALLDFSLEYNFLMLMCFMFCQGMLDSHKKNYKETIVFKGDALFNLGIAYWMIGEQALAVENMQ